MSLLDKASLVVTPNAYKESKLYSVVPSDGSGDMTVVRATTATRINSANLVEVVPRNLLTYSQDLSSGYTLNQCTNTSSQTAFDGTSNARRITNGATATDPYFEQSVSFAPTTYTWSVYVKQGTASTAAIKPVHVGIGGDVSLMTFTFATETISSSGIITSTGFTKLTNGWYRIYCSVNITSSVSSLRGRFGNPNVANVYNDWAYPQLEASTTASEFLPTTTRLNIPRIDYTNGSCPSLLVEPQRTNLLTYSEQFDNVIWVKQNATVTANSITSPSGVSNADSLIASNGTASFKGLYAIQISAAPKSFSFFAKKGNKDWAILLGYNGDNNCWFNVSNGTIGTIGSNYTNAKIENYGNGWYRCSATLNTLISGTNLGIYVSNADNSTSCTGDGTTPSLYIWGAQCEAGAYATSYIPTVASSVTRNADVISKTGISSLIGQTEGTLFCDVNLNTRASFTYLALSTDLTSSSNYLGIAFANNAISFESVVAGALQANISHSNTSTGRFKIAAGYKANDFVLYINGTQIGTDTSGTIPACSQLGLTAFSQTAPVNYNSVQLYKTKLSNTELAQLTTL
jgi:hypothetical protein